MLTVAKVAASGAAAYGLYLEGRTVALQAGDYYLSQGGERVEAPGRWLLGEQGAQALGVDVSRAVTAEDFRAVMAVRNPATGGMLRSGGAGGQAVAAIDATFSAPKSVSAVWALSSPELRAGIEAAQERAVEAALAHAVQWVPMVRRRRDRATVVRETPAELVASSWRHTTARAVVGRAPDPQLHSHVVLHGAIRRGDGRVVAIESRAWLVHQRELGAAYRAQLAAELEALGFTVQAGTGRGGRYFELSGVPAGLIEEWSGRHRQVQAAIKQRLTERLSELGRQVDAGGPDAGVAAGRLVALERSGQLLPAEQRAVAMSTRAGKSEGQLVTAGDLDYAWWQAASEHDFDARSVEALRAPGRTVERGGGLEREHELERGMLQRLTEFDATFAPRQARAVALEAGVGRDPAAGLAALERLRARREILALADGRETTRSHRGIERAAVVAAERLAGAGGDAINPWLVGGEVAALQAELEVQGATLAAEQEQAVRVACSGRRLVVIVGQAGTGKSTALTGVARAHQAAGREVLVTSTGAQAAERLAAELADAGVAAPGYSTMALQAGLARGPVKLGPNVTVVHDEAALASTREQAWLLQAASASGARVIAVGDPRQSQAVGAGGLWPAIERAASNRGGLVELSRIVRAKDAADRRDQARWRAGEQEQALAGYAQRGRVAIEETQRQAEDRALEAAQADRREGKSALVVMQASNERLDELNARAQALRAQDSELGAQAIALQGRPYGLRAEDELVLRAPSQHPRLGAVRNGTRGQVLNIADDGQSAVVRLVDGRQASWKREQLDAASARLAYVSHTFPAQGQTVDRAHVIADQHADANGTYVALTRAREHTHLYASSQRLKPADDSDGDQGDLSPREAQLARLAEQLGRTQPEVPSIATPLSHEHQVEREHAEHSASPRSAEREQRAQARAHRDHARAELDRARVEQQAVAVVMATAPDDHRVQFARANAQQAGEQARGAAARAQRLTSEREHLGRLARLGERGRALRAQINNQRDHEHGALADQGRWGQEADARQAELARAQHAWEAQHPGARDRHQAAERAYEHAEQRYQAAEQAYATAVSRELLAVSRPPPGAQPLPPQPARAQTINEAELRRRRGLGRSGPSLGR